MKLWYNTIGWMKRTFETAGDVSNDVLPMEANRDLPSRKRPYERDVLIGLFS